MRDAMRRVRREACDRFTVRLVCARGRRSLTLVASRHETAIQYNDVSVLENFHISSAWRLCLEDDLA